MSQSQLMTLSQLRKIFKRNYGAANQLANSLDVKRVYVSRVLHGRDENGKLLAAIRERAAQLIAAEQRQTGKVA